jgi:hypothetical protein
VKDARRSSLADIGFVGVNADIATAMATPAARDNFTILVLIMTGFLFPFRV